MSFPFGLQRGRSASQSRRRSSIGRRPQAEVVHSTDIDVDSLSDVDLRRELVSRGEHPGPITKLTRSLYERQLRTLLGQGDEKKRGRTSKTQSLPSTPQRGVRAFEMSGDEADGKPTPSVTRSPARATPRATPRRRLSELERLRMESPGPKSVLAMEPTGVASDAPVTRRASQRFRQDNTAKAAGAVMTTSSASSCSGGVNKMSAWGGLIAVTLLVVFTYLLFNGFLMKIPSKR